MVVVQVDNAEVCTLRFLIVAHPVDLEDRRGTRSSSVLDDFVLSMYRVRCQVLWAGPVNGNSQSLGF
jgi:hypothetical protein